MHHPTILKPAAALSMAVSLLCASMSSAIEQHIPTDEDSVVQGTFKVRSTSVVKGADAASSQLSTAITIAATVRQVLYSTNRTNSSGVVTYKDSFKRYAFGNKEILQLALGTNKITGYSLAYTNAFVNYPLDTGAFVARKGTNFSAVDVVAFNPVYEVATRDTQLPPGSMFTKYNESGFVDLTVNLGTFSNLPALASFRRFYPKKVVFGTGTNKVTETYTGMTADGKFSAIVPAP